MKIISYKNGVVPNDSRNSKFSLTQVMSDERPIGPELYLSRESGIEEIESCGDFNGKALVEELDSLEGLKELMQQPCPERAIVLGCPHHLGNWFDSTDITWSINHEVFGESNGVYRRNYQSYVAGLFEFKPGQPALLVFDIETECSDHQLVWEELTGIYSFLKDVGYLVTSNQFSRVHNEYFASYPRRTNGFHFYCIAEDGADIERFGHAFVCKSVLRAAKHSAHGEDGRNKLPVVMPTGFAPYTMLHEGTPVAPTGLELPQPQIEVVDGKLLDTQFLWDLEDDEDELYETILNYDRPLEFSFWGNIDESR